MGRKKKNKNRRKRRNAAQRRNAEALANDSYKYQKHKEHLMEVEKHERKVQDRTIFVTNVLDLNKPNNLTRLRNFFRSHYGNVEICEITNFSNKGRRRQHAPPAKVTFATTTAAERVFGKSLARARAEGKDAAVLVPSEVAYHGKHNPGMLRIVPATSQASKRVVLNETETKDPLVFHFLASSVSLGHWVPDDSGYDFLDPEFSGEDYVSQFLMEFAGFASSKVTLDLRKRILQIKVENDSDDCYDYVNFRTIIHTITFRLKQIQGVLDISVERGLRKEDYSLLFTSVDPPKLHRVTTEINQITGNVFESTERLSKLKDAPFGRCLGFKLNLSRSQALAMISRRTHFSRKLFDFGILRNEIRALEDATTLSIINLHFESQKQVLEYSFDGIVNRKLSILMRSIIDKGKVCWFDALNDKVEKNDGRECNIFQLVAHSNFHQVKTGLQYMSEMPRATRLPSKVLNEFLLEEDIDEKMPIPEYCMEMPRILVTPTRMIVQGFDVEMSNRVVRHFVNTSLSDTDFVRLTFGDENGDRLFSDDFKSAEIDKRVRDIFLHGVQVNSISYKFLAYSSSQLKESSIWMVNCTFNPFIVSEIRTWMGDFTTIKTPSKYAARMGQCFSTTIQTSEARTTTSWNSRSTKNMLRVNDKFPDVLVNNNEDICHSDGTGLIRKEHLLEVLRNVPFSSVPNNVSIIQIRFGGAKGTLTAWDFSKLPMVQPSADVCLRPSMVKFQAPYRFLEVIRIGNHVPYYLNRQVIMLLGVHGVPQSCFLNMQRVMLDDLDKMLINRDKAANMLPQLSGPDSSITGSLLHMVDGGFSPEDEPFLFSCLQAIRSHHLINLRKKSRIHVKKGAVLIGGLDETGRLPEGCVFVQVQCNRDHADFPNRGDDANPFTVLTGPVLVAKHPVMHPGDVRMLLAVDIPELRDHKNMILFSQQGIRPEADKMAGSDLDGDEFAVTWDNRLFLGKWNKCTQIKHGCFKGVNGDILSARTSNMVDLQSVNYVPMDFDSQPKPSPLEEVMDEDLADHFVNFAKADTLGRISMLWLDYASMKKSAACSECLKLAELHSVAVDFPKSGVPAQIPKELVLRADVPRPHWREKKGSDSYHCETTVGKLYDAVAMKVEKQLRRHPATAGRTWNKQGQLLCFTDTKGEMKLDLHLKLIYKAQIAERFGLITVPIDDAEKEREVVSNESLECFIFAKEQRDQYDDGLISLMNKYRIHSEGELLTGCIIKYHRLNKRRQHDLAEEVRRQCRVHRKTFRDNFFWKVRSFVVCANNDDDNDEMTEDDLDDCVRWVQTACSCDATRFIEKVSFLTGNATKTNGKVWFNLKELCAMRDHARRLAAAYYVVTYNERIRRWDGDEEEIVGGAVSLNDRRSRTSNGAATNNGREQFSLFSFPWIVADVIGAGLTELM